MKKWGAEERQAPVRARAEGSIWTKWSEGNGPGKELLAFKPCIPSGTHHSFLQQVFGSLRIFYCDSRG